jgi:hypothetical protein
MMGLVAHTYNLSYAKGISRRIVVQGQPQAKMQNTIQKIKAKMVGGMAQEVDHLLRKHEALSSRPRTANK